MTRLIVISFLLLLAIIVNGQDLDHLMIRKYINCQDVEYNCSFLIPDYYKKNLTDSLNITLKYWENRCGLNSMIFQSKVLFSIDQKKFDENSIDQKMLNYLIDYRKGNNYNSLYPNYRWGYYEQNYTNGLYKGFLDSLAQSISSKEHINLNEDYLTKFYSNKLSLKSLKNEKYSNTKLGRLYTNYLDSLIRLPEFTCSIYSGIFYPTGSAGSLGYHGIIGFGFGGIFYNNTFDLLMDFKFGPSKTEYEVIYLDSLTRTNKYTGMYIGVEYGRTVFRYKKSEYLISLGAGGERITAIPYDSKNKIDGKFLWSPDYSAGLGYRYRYNFKNNLNFQLRYQYLDFNNPRGTRFAGDSFIFRVIWVISSNMQRNVVGVL